MRRSENRNSAPSAISAAAGPSVASPTTIVRPRPQPRRSPAPTSAPIAAHTPIEVNAALPITRNPTAEAAIAPVITAAEPVAGGDHGERDHRGREQCAAERHDLADDGQRERDVGEHHRFRELRRTERPPGNGGRARASHHDRFAYAEHRSRLGFPGRSPETLSTRRYATVQPEGPQSGRLGLEGFDALLAEVRAGRPSAWDRCFRWLAPAVAGYLRMQGAREVDDLTSEVFLAIFRNIGTFSGTEANFRSWVFVIAHRRLQDERRRRFRRPASAPLDETSIERLGRMASAAVRTQSGGADEGALRAIATDRVTDLCARLAPDQREVVLLRILGDLTVDQVAQVVGKSPGAVKQLQRRAFDALRKLIEREGVPL